MRILPKLVQLGTQYLLWSCLLMAAISQAQEWAMVAKGDLVSQGPGTVSVSEVNPESSSLNLLKNFIAPSSPGTKSVKTKSVKNLVQYFATLNHGQQQKILAELQVLKKLDQQQNIEMYFNPSSNKQEFISFKQGREAALYNTLLLESACLGKNLSDFDSFYLNLSKLAEKSSVTASEFIDLYGHKYELIGSLPNTNNYAVPSFADINGEFSARLISEILNKSN